MAEPKPFGADAELALNPEPRCACVLLLDTSGSMGEPVPATGTNLVYTVQHDGRMNSSLAATTTPIDQLNDGLRAYHADLLGDSLAAQRVELSVITFGGSVRTIYPFVSSYHFVPPTLTADGDTPMGAGIEEALDAVAARKARYKQNGLHYYRPWVVLITDGKPTDSWQAAARRVREGETRKEFAFFAVGVEGTDFDTLRQIAVRPPQQLRGYDFRSLFLWLSASQKAVSRSNPGQEHQVALPPVGWATL